MTPIVLIPGLLCTAETFAAQAIALWPSGPVTIASTLQGESIAGIAGAILAQAPPRFALAGISMGGYIAMEILRQAPQRVLKLALLDTSARPDTPEQTRQRRETVALARAGHFGKVLALSGRSLLHPSRRNDPALAALYQRMGFAVGVEGFARQTEAIIGRIDSRPGLAAIGVPTLVLVGEDDPLTPPAIAMEIAASIDAARLVVIPQCGHSSTIEQPGAVNQALVEWINA